MILCHRAVSTTTLWFSKVGKGGRRRCCREAWFTLVALEAWCAVFVDVEGGGRGQLVVSAVDETWRAILCWVSTGRKMMSMLVRTLDLRTAWMKAISFWE